MLLDHVLQLCVDWCRSKSVYVFFLRLSSSNHQLEFCFFLILFYFLEKWLPLILKWSTTSSCGSMASVFLRLLSLLFRSVVLEHATDELWVHRELLKWESFCRRVFVLGRTSSELALSADAHISREWAEVWRSQTLNRSWARLEGPGVGDRREPVG